jgi:hypothetical protein
MGLVVVLLLLALIVGGIGLLVKGLLWLLIIAGALFVAGAVAGWMRRDTLAGSRSTTV